MKKKIVLFVAFSALPSINTVGQLDTEEKYEVVEKSVEHYETQVQVVSGTIGGHDYIDLGLPSGTKWATCNVGAKDISEYGCYFAWGEIRQKKTYSFGTYKWCKIDRNGYELFKKYETSGYAPDNKTVLERKDDAATANWGSAWRMPTSEELQELIDGCTWQFGYFKVSGVMGQWGTSKTNGNRIFLPAAGHVVHKEFDNENDYGCYWSSSLDSTNSMSAYYITYFLDGDIEVLGIHRGLGLSVRAVVK